MGGTLARGFLSLDASRFSWCGGAPASEKHQEIQRSGDRAHQVSAAAQGSDGLRHSTPDHEQVGTGIERLAGCRGTSLVVVRGAFGTDAGHDDREPRRE